MCGGRGNRVGVICRVIGGFIGDANPVTTALGAAYQVLDLASELLAHENVNKRIDSGIARDQDDGSYVGDISIVLRRTEVVQRIDSKVWHPTHSINNTHSQNHLGHSLSYSHHALRR